MAKRPEMKQLSQTEMKIRLKEAVETRCTVELLLRVISELLMETFHFTQRMLSKTLNLAPRTSTYRFLNCDLRIITSGYNRFIVPRLSKGEDAAKNTIWKRHNSNQVNEADVQLWLNNAFINVVNPQRPDEFGLPETANMLDRLLKTAIYRLQKEPFNLLGREEEVRMILLCLLAKEHIVFIGPPGTGKTALCTRLAKLIGTSECHRFFKKNLLILWSVDRRPGFLYSYDTIYTP